MAKTRLTYLITSLSYGGAEKGMARLISGLSPVGYDITVITLKNVDGGMGHLLPDHVSVVERSLKRNPIKTLTSINRSLRRADVVVNSLFYPSVVGVLLSRINRVPSVATWRHNTHFESRFREYAHRVLYSLSDVVLADCGAVERVLEDSFGLGGGMVSVVPIAAVDTDEYSPSAASEEYTIDGTITVCTVARLVKQKGHRRLQEVAEEVGDEYQFRVIGDGPMRDRLERSCPENVSYLGRVPESDLPSLIASSDIYFQPSAFEGLCMTVIEAMSCGIPVVASDVGGISDSVIHGEAGFLNPNPDDALPFSNSISKLAHSKGKRDRFGEAGRERVIGGYSKDVAVKLFKQKLEELGGGV